MRIVNDTMKYNGKWSRKSLTAFVSFSLAIVYEMVIPIVWNYDTKEYVFSGLLLLCGATLGLTVWDKKKTSNDAEID